MSVDSPYENTYTTGTTDENVFIALKIMHCLFFFFFFHPLKLKLIKKVGTQPTDVESAQIGQLWNVNGKRGLLVEYSNTF